MTYIYNANQHLTSEPEMQKPALPTVGRFHVGTPALRGSSKTITDANEMDKTKDLKKNTLWAQNKKI
jgi:hypothetical protein